VSQHQSGKARGRFHQPQEPLIIAGPAGYHKSLLANPSTPSPADGHAPKSHSINDALLWKNRHKSPPAHSFDDPTGQPRLLPKGRKMFLNNITGEGAKGGAGGALPYRPALQEGATENKQADRAAKQSHGFTSDVG
jgi:hypothetical protein